MGINPTLGKKFKELVTVLGVNQTELHKIQVELLKYAEILEQEETSDYVYTLSQFKPVDLPESAMSIEDLPAEHPVRQYAIERGLYGLYPLLYFDEKLYKQRLVVPFSYNGELVGWTARHINPPTKQTAKYLQTCKQVMFLM